MGDIYCLVCTGDEIESYLCSSDCSSCEHYETGKCFKIAAEDADAVERVKDLLRRLREPIAECKQLPKLTTEVFDRPDCPEWANYAAVDRDGIGRVFELEPMAEEDGWYNFGSEERIGGGRFDASDWQYSLIERPKEVIELPDWCKVDAMGWHNRCGYFKVTYIDDVAEHVYIQQVDDKSKGYLL